MVFFFGEPGPGARVGAGIRGDQLCRDPRVDGEAAGGRFAGRLAVRAQFAAQVARACVLGIKLFTQLAIPGWASTVSMLLVVLMTQTALLVLGFVFMTLQSRTTHGFLPTINIL